ncbi:MAG TPA: trypsin-like peptidase domain-containing protein [Acidimicrobiales bacterium]|nr:trypsin-like peptidase domain-containing protein [Acidimicrobiales bacterium]
MDERADTDTPGPTTWGDGGESGAPGHEAPWVHASQQSTPGRGAPWVHGAGQGALGRGAPWGHGGYPPPWGYPTWPGPGQPWPPTAVHAPSRPGPSATILATVIAAAVVVAAVGGALVGHAIWNNASSRSGALPGGSSSSGGSGVVPNPFGGGGSGGVPNPFGPGGSAGGQGSSASGGPANAAAIAKQVDPGLVDVNISVQGVPGAGTGMVLTSNGEVLTNNHVVEGATSISVTDVGNGKTYGATVLGYDRSHDVALVQLVGASGLQTVTTDASSKVSSGQGVVAVGNANGAGGTPSYAGGSITATNQSITASDEIDGTSEQLTGLLETNADIIPGDSGGPLVNSSGQVIGIDTAGSGGSGGFQFQSPADQGYAIPINQALNTASQIKAGSGSSTVHIGPTAFLGVEVADSQAQCPGGSGGFGGLGGGNGTTPSASGAYVCEAVAGDPASQAGLSSGDTITSVDGHGVTSPDSLSSVMLAEVPDTSVAVQYLDPSGQHQTATVKLGTGPAQ